MKYIQPRITHTAKAHGLIQGFDKTADIVEDSEAGLPRCTQGAYEADE